MFRKRKRTKPQRIDTLIGAGTRIEGDVHFSGGLHVDGHVRGNVQSSAKASDTLSISDSGVVEGSVAASHVVLNGAVHGDIWAAATVELGATARVSGNVYYGLIQMAVGAEINGKLVHCPSRADEPSDAQVPSRT
jgi:cytoskeletal protein CcmA (bactofilin family)